ncbi:biopolymer transporter ExbD [Rhodopirellula sp. JC740]|uniref:Biopolymer transporter ExbD n=1 Tax=Rhodopirellula halodulae TaxID=2894198 RepID=A0ABS8NDG2_9BACT|nr:biopolymer transporter ExbD [Rhodopirellula sp. JC740]MCC9640957.1 biopolymer transporter ExbD [Rhodopirellula sp. JC740]
MRPPNDKSTDRHTSDEFNMTPMIDVVFLLIIFFLVSSHLARQEHRHAVTLSKSNSALQTSTDESIAIAIDHQNKVWIRGKQIDIPDLKTYLDGLHNPSSPAIRLRVDRQVGYSVVETVLQSLHDLGIRNVSIATLPQQPKT